MIPLLQHRQRMRSFGLHISSISTWQNVYKTRNQYWWTQNVESRLAASNQRRRTLHRQTIFLLSGQGCFSSRQHEKGDWLSQYYCTSIVFQPETQIRKLNLRGTNSSTTTTISGAALGFLDLSLPAQAVAAQSEVTDRAVRGCIDYIGGWLAGWLDLRISCSNSSCLQ